MLARVANQPYPLPCDEIEPCIQVVIGMKIYINIALGALLVIAWAAPVRAQIWRWVDSDGVVNYSNSRPPADARDAALFLAASEADPHATLPAPRADTGVPPASGGRKVEGPPDTGRPALGDDREGAENDWSYVQAYPGSVFYSPFSGRAYSRRYHHRPFKPYRYHSKPPSYRRHLRYFRQRHVFGERRYDRHYYSNPYRYRSSAPRYNDPGHRHRYGGAYKPRHGREHFSPRAFHRRGPGTIGHGRGHRGSGGHRLRR